MVRALYRRDYANFLRPCNVRRVQMDYLGALLSRNAGTEYGRRFHFDRLHTYRAFARAVPLTTYEDYAPYIEKIANGAGNILTQEPVLLFEPTSGSSGGRKLIPYTASLKAEFQRGIRPWLCDLYTRVPGLCAGKSYWSITPVTQGKEFTPCGIPIGFEEDTAYFGKLEGRLMREIMAVSGNVKFVRNMEQFWHSTAVQMLTCGTLSMMSVWNPTFLSILCSYIRDHAGSLARTLSRTVDPARLQAARDERFDRVFPDLRLISCWADGSAGEDAAALQGRFPGVLMQPKGLLATECFTSFPLIGETGARLSIFSHFFEFRSLADGSIFTADALAPGIFELIVTTGGGFYRYQTGDLVEVLGTFPDHPPVLKFLRRKGISSDLCGEKLTEGFVRGVCKNLGIAGEFCLLAPDGKGYTLYTSARISPDVLETALCESYHYKYCRKLGQLSPAKVIRVSGDPARNYLERLNADGMRLGDIKPAFLSPKPGWGHYFETEVET